MVPRIIVLCRLPTSMVAKHDFQECFLRFGCNKVVFVFCVFGQPLLQLRDTIPVS